MFTNADHPSIDYPPYLAGTTELRQHLDQCCERMPTTSKGNFFAEFARELLPLTEVGSHFEKPDIRDRSHDGGVDLVAVNDGGERVTEYLVVQAKYTIGEKVHFDSIFSKFQDYYDHQQLAGGQPTLFGGPTLAQFKFVIVTASRIAKILVAYEASSMASRDFYHQLRREGCITIIDISDILATLKDVYKRSVVVPHTLQLHLAHGPLEANDVYIGIVSSRELVTLYEKFGDALFFDNIREFLGLYSGRKQTKPQDGPTVNEEIVRTIKESPHLFLQRNNGIVFRAKDVALAEDGGLLLQEANIINGCQTTMCLVLNPEAECLVPVKIVKTGDSWDVAKAANYQTHISIIDLNLARYLRPQVVAKVGSHFGTHMNDRRNDSVFVLIDTVNTREIAYEEVKHLFIGLFSRSPGNVFSSNYTKLRTDLIEEFYASEANRDLLFETLFLLHEASVAASNEAEQTFVNKHYATLLQRFYRSKKTDYHAFLTLLAVSVAVNLNLDDTNKEDSSEKDVATMLEFLHASRALVENEPERFSSYFRVAFMALAQKSLSQNVSDNDILKRMHSDVTSQSFSGLFRQAAMFADNDPQLATKAANAPVRVKRSADRARPQK